MLILAGISISSLTGSGLFQKAQEATTKYTEAQIKEQIEIAIYNSRMNSNGMIDLEELEKGLLEIKGITKDSIEKQGEDGKLPWIVTVEDWKFEIDENGEVKVVKGISIPKNLKIVEGSTETIIATIDKQRSIFISLSCCLNILSKYSIIFSEVLVLSSKQAYLIVLICSEDNFINSHHLSTKL